MANETMPSSPRLNYVDNLRSTVIFLVVAMHAAVTYSHFGSWYYNAPEPINRWEGMAFGLIQGHLQAFFMGLLFLIAGYFTPISYDRKGGGHFLWDRFVRLGLPSLFFIFAIHDTMGHFMLHWHGNDTFWHSYAYYVTHGDWLDGSGPMWFAIALLAFSLGYALIRAVLPHFATAFKVPGIRGVLCGGLIVAGLTFLARVVWPIGTAWHNMQFCFFAQYIVLFAVGVFARRGDWFATFSTRSGYRLLIGAAILGPAAWLGLQFVSPLLPAVPGAYNGGGHWQSAIVAAWEQMFGVAFCAGLLVLFREKFNTGGRLSKLVSANSFGIYVFHPPVLVATSLALAGWVAPALCKFAVATVLAFLASLAFVHLIARRIPLLKSIL